MWPETLIKSIEILPDWTLQIDFVEDWAYHRSFITGSNFFSMYWKAMEKHWKQMEEYRQRRYLEHFISEWKEWDDLNEDFSIFTIEQAKKELQELKLNSTIDYEWFKMYL